MPRGWIAIVVLLCACGQGGEGPVGAAAVRATRTYSYEVTRDVVYAQALRRDAAASPRADRVDLTLDVYEPIGTDGPGRPAVVCIPGGGFKGSILEPGDSVLYSRRLMQPFVELFCRRGWVVFVLEHRLADDFGSAPAGWPPPPEGFDPTWYRSFYPGIRDAKAALRWIHANAQAYSVSEDHISVIGGSAGGALGTALGMTDPGDYTDELTVEDDPTLASTHLGFRSDVRTVVTFWGNTVPVDALQRRDGRSRYDAGDASIAIVHGRSDPTLPFVFAENLRDSCVAASIPFDFQAFDGGHAAWDLRIDGKSLPEYAYRFIVEQQDLEVR